MVESLEASGDVSIAKDGTLYIADFGATIKTAGGQHVYRLPAGQPLSIFSSGFGGASGNEIGPDGNLYQSDVARGEVYRISGDGKRTRIAEGLKSPVGIAPAADGSVYVVQCGAHTITRIGQDGSLATVAEGAPLNCPNGLAFGPDGSLYAANFRDGNLVRVELPTGRMSLMATIPGGSNGHLAWANDRFYLASFGGHRLYEVGADGAVCPLAGTGEPGNENGPAQSATFFRPNGMAVSPDGDSLYTNTIHVAENGGNPGLHPNALRKVSGLRSRPSCTAAAGEGG
jgi:sugar lactone lactonase YvrE